jgi:hypothetical protein
MTIYNSKEMKTARRRVDDAMKEKREDHLLLGGDFNWRKEKGEQEIGKRKGGMGKENSKTRWKMERGRD